MSVRRLHAVVHGRVQGVNFRWHTRNRARALGLQGWVRNSVSGQEVEVIAEGPAKALEELLAFLRQGPPMAAVDTIDSRWEEPHGGFDDFVIRS